MGTSEEVRRLAGGFQISTLILFGTPMALLIGLGLWTRKEFKARRDQ